MNEKLKYVYIQEVIKYLPSKQKEDIRNELETIIDDQLENEHMSLEDVLIELGNPKDLAYRYLEESPYLIGPKYKDNYLNTIKLIIPINIFIITVLNLVTWILANEFSFVELLDSIFYIAVISFTYITIAFMIAEKVNKKTDNTDAWHPDKMDLEKYDQIPYKQSSIWAGLIIFTIFILLFNIFPEIIGVHSLSTNEHITFFDMENYTKHLIWIDIAYGILLIRLFIRFFLNKKDKISIILSVTLHFVASFILIFVFLTPALLNPSLTLEFANMNFPDFVNFSFIYNIFRLISFIIVLVFVVESYKEISERYKIKKH